MAGLLGKGVLVNWGGVIAEAEDDYNAWHSLEHMPERIAVPGFLRGRRAKAIDGTPETLKYFMMYEAETADVFVSGPYLARLNDPTPWTRRILSTYIAPSRTVCRVVASRGHGTGGYLATIQLSPADVGAAIQSATGGWLDSVMKRPGILGAHALAGESTLGQQPTAEKTFRESRGEPDRTVALALLIEGLDQETTSEAMQSVLMSLDPALQGRTTANLYRTQHVIMRQDL